MFTTKARVVKQTDSVFYWWAPSAVVFVCTDRLVSPCPTHLRHLFVRVSVSLDGPWHRHSLKRRQHNEDAIEAKTKRPKKKFRNLGRYGSHLFCAQGCPKAGKKKNCTTCVSLKNILLRSHNSVRHRVRSSRPTSGIWQVRPLAMVQNRDQIGEHHHEISRAIICNNKKSTTNSDANSI